MKIKAKVLTKTEDGETILEVRFLRGETLLHNVFYLIDGLSKEELIDLKKEALSKFATVFPEISAKDIMLGFEACEPKIQALYEHYFSGRGGHRKNSGRPKGSKKPEAEKVKPRKISLTDDEYRAFLNSGGARWLRPILRQKKEG
jgi:hypothetical protein